MAEQSTSKDDAVGQDDSFDANIDFTQLFDKASIENYTYILKGFKAFANLNLPLNAAFATSPVALDNWTHEFGTLILRLETISADLRTATAEQSGHLNDFLMGMWPSFITFLSAPHPFTFNQMSEFWKTGQAKLASKVSRKNKLTDPEGFSMPKRPAKAQSIEEIIPPLTTSNTYSPISPDEPEMDADDGSTVQDNIPKPKSEPIFIKTEPGYREMLEQIFSVIKTRLPMKLVSDFAKIIPQSETQFREIQRLLVEKNIKFFNMNPKSERPRKVIIKGISPEISSEMIHIELTRLGYNVQRVTRMRRLNKETLVKDPLKNVICNVYNSEIFQTIFDITEFLDFYVVVDTFKNKRPRQCYNCQKFNHSSDTCQLDPVCLKCAGRHKTSECKKPRDTPATCGNCKKDHPANFQGCEFNPLVIREKRNQMKTIGNSSVPPPLFKTPAPAHPTNNLTIKPTYSQALSNPISSQNLVAQPSVIPTNKNSTVNSPQNSAPSAHPSDPTIDRLEKIVSLLEQIQNLCTGLGISASSVLQNFDEYENKLNTSTGKASNSRNPPSRR